jgi:hypothetical protein
VACRRSGPGCADRSVTVKTLSTATRWGDPWYSMALNRIFALLLKKRPWTVSGHTRAPSSGTLRFHAHRCCGIHSHGAAHDASNAFIAATTSGSPGVCRMSSWDVG